MCSGGHEGTIAKRADAAYVGDRTKGWLKIKCTKRQEFVVGGWRPGDDGSGMSSLILGTYEKGKLVYRGRVGTGFTDAMRERILAQLERRRLDKPAFAAVPSDISRKARWVQPELVAEIAYAEITPDGSLRHASFKGLREDKHPSQVVLEATEPGDPDGTPDLGAGVQIAARLSVRLTNPDKVIYPGSKITKAELVAYYAAVSEKMMPYLRDHPLSLVRSTDGHLSKTFFQKHQLPGMPEAIKSGQLSKMSGKESQVLWIEDLAGLVRGVQMNTLEFHVWGCDRHAPDLPDRMVFDIDPDEGLDFSDVRQAAIDIRDVLNVIGLGSWPLVSGGKGIHVVVPLVPQADWNAVNAFCQDFAELLAKTEPRRFVANMSKARRTGKVFLDYLRNGQGSTAICPWSTRARAGGSVAMPVNWQELNNLSAANTFDIFEAARRAGADDPWRGYFDSEQVLTESMRQAVRRLT